MRRMLSFNHYLKDETPSSQKDDVHKAFVFSPCNILVKNGQSCFYVPFFKGHELHRNCWGRDWNCRVGNCSLQTSVVSYCDHSLFPLSLCLRDVFCLSAPTWGSWDGRSYDSFGCGLGTKPRHLKHKHKTLDSNSASIIQTHRLKIILSVNGIFCRMLWLGMHCYRNSGIVLDFFFLLVFDIYISILLYLYLSIDPCIHPSVHL